MQIVKPTLKTHIAHALKICKHEFLMSRVLVIIVCILIGIDILILFTWDTRSSKTLFILSYGLLIMQYFTFFICGITYVLSAAISFYQGIFGKQAYLTHALPVYIETIICAKILVYFLWFLIIFSVFILTIYIFAMKNNIAWNSFVSLHSFIWFIIMFVILILQEIVYIFMVVALVHRKKSYTLFIGILVYFTIKILIMIVGSLLFSLLLKLDFMQAYSNTFINTFIPICCFNVVLLLLFYFVCHRIIKYKLSL